MNSKYLLSAAGAVGAAALLIFAAPNNFGLGRNMEIAVNMMRELSVGYVDPVDPDRLMLGAAQGMVRDLDPYTEFIPADEVSDFELMTTGKYGGIGSLIRKKGDRVVFAQPYKGSPADRAGIRIGDKILSIDGRDARDFTTEQVSAALKGDPGSKVRLEIERLDGGKRSLVLTRERISIPSIPYAGWAAPGIGYLRHSDFTEGSAEEMRAAIERLRAEAPLSGLILDYRSNGGGILQEAVKILSMFLPKGTEVVSTRGRTEESLQSFRTASEPAFPDLPLVVLINGSSASAAEIVAGALQDLDRAVLVGQRSFGKGLVQSTRPLGYNAMLKLTTAKYRIPSGRCIQAVDYSHSQEGSVSLVPDSLVSEFATQAGRKVFDGGGIMPDIVTEPEYMGRFAATLYALGFIDDFGDEYLRTHPEAPADLSTFTISDEDYDDFKRFMADKSVPYESESRRALRQLREAARADRFSDIEPQIEALEAALCDDTGANLDTYRREIVNSIANDIVLRHGYSEAVVARSLGTDKEVARAVELLSDLAEYGRILAEQDTQRK